MTVVVEVTLPTEAFEVGKAFENHPSTRNELERLVPTGEDEFPYFWVYGSETTAVEATLREQDHIVALERVTETDEVVLFSVAWDRNLDGVVGVLREATCCLLEVTGTNHEWLLRIRFPRREHVVKFYTKLTERRIPFTIQRKQDVSRVQTRSPLSQQQREALRLAYGRGYFAVPRECKLSDLADLPGCKPEDITLEVTGNRLYISANRAEEEGFDRAVQRRRRHRVEQTVELPAEVEADEAQVSCENGVCQIRLPKREQEQRRKIGFE